MNEAHEELCSSAEWGEYLATELLPKVMASADLGDHLLEVGTASDSPPTSCGRR